DPRVGGARLEQAVDLRLRQARREPRGRIRQAAEQPVAPDVRGARLGEMDPDEVPPAGEAGEACCGRPPLPDVAELVEPARQAEPDLAVRAEADRPIAGGFERFGERPDAGGKLADPRGE